MDEDIVYDGYLEVHDDGSCLAQLLDLPGCYAHGASESEAVAALAACIPPYFAWLSRHDDYTPDVHGPFRVVVAERVRENTPGLGTTGAFFSPDFEAVTDEDLDWALALLDWAYEDLYACVARGVGAGGEPAEQARAIVQKVTTQQLWLLSRIAPDSLPPRATQIAGESLDQLRQVWRASLKRLRASSERERAQTIRLAGEQWSLRKALRRSILLVRLSTGVLEG